MSLLPSVFAELTKYPTPMFSIGDFEVNNSMISAAIVTIIIIAVVQAAMRAPKLIPTGLQNFVEWLVEVMSNFLEGITGRETMQRGFWYFGSVFVFIFLGNLLGLIPGVGTFGFGHGTTIWNFEVDRPFLRGANANDNLTAAYTAIFFFMWFYWCIRQIGLGGLLKHIFGSQVHFPYQIVNVLFVIIFFLVGWVEVASILVIRPIAFTFRLYGNIFGGEYMLDSIYKMNPNIGFITLIPCYFYETLVAFVQAFVFFVLTAVFTGVYTNTDAHSTKTASNH
ncbi:MAG TPA: F0F1 ATP synthase subunit A [Candidatus Methylacidiphilales bacterium]|nr:F0F1 ATP synthase subunit A [Candidatus Methylacidiphilales bacterium]